MESKCQISNTILLFKAFFFVLWDWLLVKSKNSVINGTGLC